MALIDSNNQEGRGNTYSKNGTGCLNDLFGVSMTAKMSTSIKE